MIEQALEHYKSGDFAEAEALYRKMLEEEPDNPEVLFMLSLSRQQQNDLEEPVQLLGHALRVQPQNPTLHHALGSVYIRRRELDLAESSFFEAVALDPNYVEAQNAIAYIELGRGRFPAAEHALRRVLKSDPQNLQGLVNMGIALMEQGQIEDAIGYLQQATQQQPDYVDAQAQLGRAFMLAGNPGFAIQCFNNAIDKYPNSPELYHFLAEAESACGHYQDAIKSYRRVLERGAERVDTLIGLGKAEAKLGHTLAAENVFLRALRLGGSAEEIMPDYANMLLVQKRYQDVIEKLTPLLNGDEENIDFRQMVAQAHLGANQHKEALDLIRPLLVEGAPDTRTRLLFAEILMKSEEYSASESQLQRLLEEPEPAPRAVYLQALRYMNTERADEAIELLRETQKRHDLSQVDRSDIAAQLGDALHMAGQYQAAWEQYLSFAGKTAEVLHVESDEALHPELNEASDTAMVRDVAWSWPPQPPQDGRQEPIFLFAWPGTGRDQLIRALSAHPSLNTLKDRFPRQLERRLHVSYPRGERPLSAMTEADVMVARKRYEKLVRVAEGGLVQGSGLLRPFDTLWFSAEAIPTLYRLFPQSHMIVLDRDPKDLELMWLRAGYKDLGQMNEIYEEQQRLLNLCREAVPMKYINIEADKLAENPGAELRTMVASLGLAWDEAVQTAFAGDEDHSPFKPGDYVHYQDWMQGSGDSTFFKVEDLTQ